MKSLQRVEVLSACKEIDVKVPLRCHALRVYWQASGGAVHGFALSLGCFVWLNQFFNRSASITERRHHWTNLCCWWWYGSGELALAASSPR